jgi:hypothetical protein
MPLIVARAKGKVIMPDLTVVEFGVKFPFRDPLIAEMARVADDLDAQMALTYLGTAGVTAMLAGITATGLFMSIHTGSPSTTGANEIVGNTGYTGTRPAIAWAAANTGTGVVVSNTTQTFPLLVLQAGGIPNFGLWTLATAGVYLTGGTTTGLTGSIPIGANVTFTSAVTLTIAG